MSSERVKAADLGVRHDIVSAFGERCIAVYVLGSLARGGFSEAVSDIDLGVVLAGPLEARDASSIDAIAKLPVQAMGRFRTGSPPSGAQSSR